MLSKIVLCRIIYIDENSPQSITLLHGTCIVDIVYYNLYIHTTSATPTSLTLTTPNIDSANISLTKQVCSQRECKTLSEVMCVVVIRTQV